MTSESVQVDLVYQTNNKSLLFNCLNGTHCIRDLGNVGVTKDDCTHKSVIVLVPHFEQKFSAVVKVLHVCVSYVPLCTTPAA